MPPHQLLIVDTSAQTLTLLKNGLEAKNFNVVTAHDIHKAFEHIRRQTPDLIIANTRLPEIDPFESYYQLLEVAGSDTKIIALSNCDTDQDRATAKETGFAAFLAKPLHLRTVIATIRQTLEGRRNAERTETRQIVSIEMIIQILDDRGRIIDTERTISENISRRGACLLTLNGIETGDIIAIATNDNSFQSRAVVRGTFIGSDRIRRINIEFIDEKWPVDL